MKFRGLRAKLNFPDGMPGRAAPQPANVVISSEPVSSAQAVPVPVSTPSTSTSSLSQASSRSTQSAYGMLGISSSEARGSSPYYPSAQLATSGRSMLQLQAVPRVMNPDVAGGSSSQSGQQPGQGFIMSSQPFTSQPGQWQPQLHPQIEPVVVQQSLQTMSRSNIPDSMYSAHMTRPTLNLPYENVYAEDHQQVHDPILHYEQYIMGGPRSVDFREANQGGQALNLPSSGRHYPSTTLANQPHPQYIELSYEQIFDQPPGELQSVFPETVSPSGGLPLDPFDDPPPHGQGSQL